MKINGIYFVVVPADSASDDAIRQMLRKRVEDVFGPSLTEDKVLEIVRADRNVPEASKAILYDRQAKLQNLVWYQLVEKTSTEYPVKGGGIVAIINPHHAKQVAQVGYLSPDKPGIMSIGYVRWIDIKRVKKVE